MAARLIIGLMSGTSVDAIDAALVRVERTGEGYRADVEGHLERAWPGKLRKRVLAVMAPARATTQEICELNFLVAREFAAAVEALLKAQKLEARAIEAVASHGQTVCHLPPEGKGKRRLEMGSTLQLGDVAVLATLTGITTVGNFRTADMAVGGQGAPLVPWADDVLLSSDRLRRCVQNIGGIANVTYLPPRAEQRAESWTFFTPLSAETKVLHVRPPVVAFDTGPGNMLMDAVAQLATRGRQKFDRGGRLAAAGELDGNLLRRLQRHLYFAIKPPKSTGREAFGSAYAEKLVGSFKKNRKGKVENLVHTLTRLTAWSIADAYRRYLPAMPDEVIVCGGGADNPVLVGMLGEELGAGVALRRMEEFGIPNKAKEAASFALLGAATLDGIPSNVPSVTGARRAVVLGVVARP